MNKIFLALLLTLCCLFSCKTADAPKTTHKGETPDISRSDVVGRYTGYLVEKDPKHDIKFCEHVWAIIRDSSMTCLVGFDLSTLVKVSGDWIIKNDTIILYSKKPQYEPYYRGKYAEGSFYFKIIDTNTLLFFPDDQFYTNPTWKKRQKSVCLTRDKYK